MNVKPNNLSKIENSKIKTASHPQQINIWRKRCCCYIEAMLNFSIELMMTGVVC